MRMSTLAVILVLTTVSHWQPTRSSQEFGEVTADELEMTSLPEDPDADAVILFDLGSVTPDTFTQHRRVKVFSKRGTEHADISIPFRRGEQIVDLEGYTVTKDGRKLWMDENQVFTKEGKYWNEMVFTLPGAEQGCVFEYRYSKLNEYKYVLGPWYFQNEIFTRKSEVSLKLEEGWLYSYFFKNAGRTNTEPKMVDIESGMEYIWTFEDVPPIKEEPYVACINDYRTAIYFERSGYKPTYFGIRDAIDTWADCGELADEIYKRFDYDKSQVEKKAAKLIKNAPTDSAKAATIYDFMRQKIEWNGERGIFNMNEKSFRKILSRMEGTATEKNFLLLKLLEHAEIEASPVLISTRDNGRVEKKEPGLIQFNHLIVRIRLGHSRWYLDSVDRMCPFGTLPAEGLGNYGLLLDGAESCVVLLPTPELTSRNVVVTRGRVQEDGALICSISATYEGYPNMSVRERIQEEGEEDFAKDHLLKVIPSASVDEIAFSPLDSADQPLKVSVNFAVPEYAQMVNENLYLNPAIAARLQSNPFESESRNFSIDFPYPFAQIEEAEFLIPDGLEVRELPEDIHREIPGAEFRKTFSVEGNKLRCIRELTVSKLVFPVYQYQEIRQLHQEIVTADQLQVVLAKKP
jgi:hypothetical protein